MSDDIQKRSRSELQNLIFSVNKTKKLPKVIRTPKFRFRALVRTVINNLKWLTEQMVIEKVSSKHPKLTIEHKSLLRIPVENRTAEEKEMLSKLMSQLQCFDRYPPKVQECLTASAMFAYFPPGRVLVVEGYPSVAMYFIISGQANITKKAYDPGTKKIKDVDVAVMSAGDAFGEINILHNEPWPTTVTTTTHIEILTVLKENFQSILEEFLGKQQREITKCLNEFSYFKDWSQRTIVECCILARVVEFESDTLIMGDNCGDLLNAYFVVEGNCRVIYHMQVQHIPRERYTELRVLETSNNTEDENFPLSDILKNVEKPQRRKIMNPFLTGLIVDQTLQQILDELPLPKTRQSIKEIQNHFCQVATLVPGACFGIGESLDNKFILGYSQPVSLLRIPKTFLKLHNKGNIWGRVREFFNHTYPGPHIIFSQFLTNQRWGKSRAKYLESLMKVERPFTGLTSAEAPYYTRLTYDINNPIFRRIEKVVCEKQNK